MEGSEQLGEDDGDGQVNSLCAIYAELIEKEIRSDDTDEEQCVELLRQIRKNCSAVSHTPGETPEHLEEHLYT